MPGTLRLIPEAGETFVVEPNRSALVGRRRDCDLVISESTMSRHHARIEIIGGKWHVTDLDSSNGTFVNGKRVAVHELQHGDEVRFGSNGFLVEVEEDVVAVGAAPVPGPAPGAVEGKPPATRESRRRPVPSERRKAAVQRGRKKPVERRAPEKRRGAAGRQRPSGRQKPEVSGRRRRSDDLEGKRPKNWAYYFAGGAGVLFVVVVLAAVFAGGGARPAAPAGKGSAASREAPLAKAREMYRECFRLMSAKNYREALDAVDEALKFHLELLDRYSVESRPDLQWLEDNAMQLSKWERQVGTWAAKDEIQQLRK